MIKNRTLSDPFTDLLFNTLLGFSLLFFISIIFMNPIAKLGNVNFKAEYIITVTWPEDQPDDIDVWVQDPNRNLLSYRNSNVGWLHLDRDDQGDINDTVMINGVETVYPINQEVVTIRGIVSGEYIVNLQYYKSTTQQPVPVTIKIEKVNPSLRVVYVDKVLLENEDDEKTVLRFYLDANGEVASINHLPKKFTNYGLEVLE
ncbi:MAG: hypothetical protein QNJ69_05230 [Gammaproteobacteria bacterium]|nr:hypothetical protein [Gammaproteobacteria bacterium]